MQSLNEELKTINAELSSKVRGARLTQNDLKNLFESTQIATNLSRTRPGLPHFTPAGIPHSSICGSGDIGRPLTNLARNLEYPELKEHIANGFQVGEMVAASSLRDAGGRHYLTPPDPLSREMTGVSRGVVVTRSTSAR